MARLEQELNSSNQPVVFQPYFDGKSTETAECSKSYLL